MITDNIADNAFNASQELCRSLHHPVSNMTLGQAGMIHNEVMRAVNSLTRLTKRLTEIEKQLSER